AKKVTAPQGWLLPIGTNVEVIKARGDLMKEKELRPREQQVVELLLQGCDNDEISKQLNMARRTVKAHFNRLFSRFGISGGVNRENGRTYPNEREQRVIALVAQGLKNKEVASEIGTTEHVVKNYLRTIYDKLGLWNRVELALWYEARRFEGMFLAPAN